MASSAAASSSKKLFAASSLRQVQYYGFTSVRFYANAQAVNVKELDCSLELKELHDRFTTEVQGKRTVPLKLLRNILEQCNSTEDVDLAFRIMKDYRVYRSSKARVKQNFNQNISTLAISASLRSRSYGLGLKALWKHNVFGLSPTIENAHMFLSHARKEKDMDLMKKTLRTMLKNLVMPTAQTAEIVIRICKDSGDLNLMFNWADEFLQNGVMLSSPVFDILIATAANFGFVEKVFEAQKWREEAGLDHTMASAFAIAKAHILQGEPQIGVDLIAKYSKDKVKVQKYLTMLVRAWPSELVSKKEQTQVEGDDHIMGLKDNVVLFAKALSNKFRGVSIDAEQEFGKDQRSPNEGNGADEIGQSSAV